MGFSASTISYRSPIPHSDQSLTPLPKVKMKFTMISALAATLAIVFAAPTPADQPEHLPGSKPLFPNGRLSLNVTTAGNELNGYLPNLVVGYTGKSATYSMPHYAVKLTLTLPLGEVFISKRKQSNQPVRE